MKSSETFFFLFLKKCGTLHEFACHPCAGPCDPSLCCSSFGFHAAELGTDFSSSDSYVDVTVHLSCLK